MPVYVVMLQVADALYPQSKPSLAVMVQRPSSHLGSHDGRKPLSQQLQRDGGFWWELILDPPVQAEA